VKLIYCIKFLVIEQICLEHHLLPHRLPPTRELEGSTKFPNSETATSVNAKGSPKILILVTVVRLRDFDSDQGSKRELEGSTKFINSETATSLNSKGLSKIIAFAV